MPTTPNFRPITTSSSSTTTRGGFFLSPEIGVSIFPRPDYRFGFHVALYYNYATNSGDVLTYSVNNLNNFGIRVGISF